MLSAAATTPFRRPWHSGIRKIRFSTKLISIFFVIDRSLWYILMSRNVACAVRKLNSVQKTIALNHAFMCFWTQHEHEYESESSKSSARIKFNICWVVPRVCTATSSSKWCRRSEWERRYRNYIALCKSSERLQQTPSDLCVLFARPIRFLFPFSSFSFHCAKFKSLHFDSFLFSTYFFFICSCFASPQCVFASLSLYCRRVAGIRTENTKRKP